MKLRNDFVSNSSSCSFIIHLQTRKDVDEFKKIQSKLAEFAQFNIMYGNKGTLWFDSNVGCDFNPECGDFVQIDCGEDHDMSIIDAYIEAESIVMNNLYKFKVYQDADAHYTCGEKFK